MVWADNVSPGAHLNEVKLPGETSFDLECLKTMQQLHD